VSFSFFCRFFSISIKKDLQQGIAGQKQIRQYRTKIVRQMRRQIFRQMKQKAE
jgi:hypothetical protein